MRVILIITFLVLGTHEENQLATLGKPGFYIFERAIAIPKIAAVPLTFLLGVTITYWICSKIEKYYRAYLKQQQTPIGSQQILHRVFSVCTFLAFNCFFIYGGRPEIIRLPIVVQLLFNAIIVLVSALWLVRTWNCSEEKYNKDSLAHSFRRQLEKLPIDVSSLLNQRSLDDLTSDELFLLASVIPKFREKERSQIYQAIFQDGLVKNNFTSADSFEKLKQIRSDLGLNEEEHYSILSQIIENNPDLLYQTKPQTKDYSAAVKISVQNSAKISPKNRDISSQADKPTLIRRKQKKGVGSRE